jgi:hypothetical protein
VFHYLGLEPTNPSDAFDASLINMSVDIATHSFRELFDLPVFDLGFNTNIPTLIFTYGAMLYCLHYFVSKYKTA